MFILKYTNKNNKITKNDDKNAVCIYDNFN